MVMNPPIGVHLERRPKIKEYYQMYRDVAKEQELGPLRVTTQGSRIFGSGIVKKIDPRGGEYYWIGGEELGYVDGDAGSDVQAVASGCVSVTPLQTDLTATASLGELEGWSL